MSLPSLTLLAALCIVTLPRAGAAQPPAADARLEVLHVLETSRVVIRVGKAGAFGFAGHAHEVEAPVKGTVVVDPEDAARSRVILQFESAALKVTGQGEPAQDVPEVQRVMASERVLDVKRYPTIEFRSRRVDVKRAAGSTFELVVTGDLTLHGVTKPLSLPVRATMSGGTLTARGTATIKQSDFGIEPVTAAGGTIRVKDSLDVEFEIRAGK